MMLEAVPHSRGVLYRFDPRANRMQVVAAAGEPVPIVGTELPMDAFTAAAGDLVNDGETSVIDFDALPPEGRGLGERFGVRLLLAVPIAFRDNVLGAVVLDDPAEPRRPFDADDIRIVEAFASQAAAVMETSRLFEEQALRARRLEALNEIMSLATSSLYPQEVAERTLDHIVRRLGVDMVTLWRYEPATERLMLLSDIGIGPDFHDDFADGISIHDPFVVSIAFLARRPIAFDQAHVDEIPEPVSAAYTRAGRQLGALLVLPVPGRDSMRGAISLAWAEPRWLDDDAVAFFSSAISALAVAAENAELFDEVRQRRERIEALHAVTEMAVSSLEAAETSRRTLRYLVKEMGVEMAALWTVDEVGALRVRATENYPPEYERMSPLADVPHSDPMMVLSTCKPLVVSDVGLARQEAREVFDSIGVRCGAYVIVPIQAQGKTFGTLHLAWHEPRPISAADVEFYSSVANEVGIALENARLYEAQVNAEREASRQLATTTLLLTAADAFAGLSGLDGVLFALGEILLQASGHSRITIYLWDERREELCVRWVAGASTLPVGLVVRWGEFSPGTQEVLLTRKARVVDVSQSPPETRELADEHAVTYVLALPLVRGDHLIGLVGIDEPGCRKDFSDREVDLFETIAAQASIAIENSRLFEAEHRVAETLQHALLEVPADVEGIEHAEMYRSATETAQVGGDFYDLYEISPGRVGIVIGDVSGKGLEAASMTAKVRDTLRVCAMDGLSPAAVVSKTNDLLCRFTPTEVFVTLFFGTLDTHTGALTYVAAGHPAPLVLHEDGEVDSLVSAGPIVGAFSDVTFDEQVASFRRGDVLVLFTDGLVEARSGGVMYGQERAASALGRCVGGAAASLPDLLGALSEDAHTFAQGNLRDDMALLAVRRSVHAD